MSDARDGLILLDSTTCKAHRAASGAVGSTAAAEALGRSRGGLCSKLHACADGAGRTLRLAGLIAWLLACLLSLLVIPNQTGTACKPHPSENRLFHGRPVQVQR